MWNKLKETVPLNSKRVVIVSDDSAAPVYINKDGYWFHGEDGTEMNIHWFDKNSIWAYLPDNFDLHFMTITRDDWY